MSVIYTTEEHGSWVDPGLGGYIHAKPFLPYPKPELPVPFEARHMTPVELVDRLLGVGTHKWEIRVHEEDWGKLNLKILHIALCHADSKKIVRFEEEPHRFPSHGFIDKLRLLGNG